jgi:hypothetical protein
MVLLTMLHLCNGAANLKNLGNKILVPNVSFPSPNGGALLVPPLQWWNRVSSTIWNSVSTAITNGANTSSK